MSARRRVRGHWRRLAFGSIRLRPGDGFGWCPVTRTRFAAARPVRRLREVLEWSGSWAVTDAWTRHGPRDTAPAVADFGVLCTPESAKTRCPPGLRPMGWLRLRSVGACVPRIARRRFRAWWSAQATVRLRPSTSGNRQARAGRKTVTVWRPFFGSGGEPRRRSLGLVRCGQTL